MSPRLGLTRTTRRTAAFYALLVLGLAALLTFGLESIFRTSASPASGVARDVTVSRGTVQSAVTTSGNISPVTADSVNFATTGTLAAVDVQVGQSVRAGQVLATLDPTTAEQNLTAARAALVVAKDTLASAQAGGTAAQLAQSAVSLQSAEASLTADEQQLATDRSTLATAETQLRLDTALGCPAALSGGSGSGSGSAAASAASAATSSGAASSGAASSGSSTTGSGTSSGSATSGAGASGASAVTSKLATVSVATTPTTPTTNAPVATTQTATSITTTGAVLGASVNPGGLDTTYDFQYGTSTAYGASTPTDDAGSGTVDVGVSATVASLAPATTYDYRIVATSSLGTVYGAPQSFTTSSAPVATTGSASGSATTTITLGGSVNPGGVETSYVFQYGTTASFGHATAPVDAGAATSAVPASAVLTGLRPATTYVYRIVATSSLGTSRGLTATFTTATSSCSTDRSAITTDAQSVGHEQSTVAQQQASIAATRAASAPSAPTVVQDAAQVTANGQAVASDAKALAETTLTAPIAGTVTAVSGTVGSTVGAGGSAGAASSAASGSSVASSSGVVTIDNLHALEVVAPFAEADATKIAVGQPATVTMAALSNTEVAGTVTAVALTPTVANNVVEYNDTVLLDSPPETVRDGMTADVSVTVASASGVLLAPNAAITTTGSRSTVTVLRSGKEQVVPVTLGIVGASSTEILTGVAAGDVLVEPTVTAAASTSPLTIGGGLGGFGGGRGFVARLGG